MQSKLNQLDASMIPSKPEELNVRILRDPSFGSRCPHPQRQQVARGFHGKTYSGEHLASRRGNAQHVMVGEFRLLLVVVV